MPDLPTLLSLIAPFILLGALSFGLQRVLVRRRRAEQQVDFEPRSAPARALNTEPPAVSSTERAARRVA